MTMISELLHAWTIYLFGPAKKTLWRRDDFEDGVTRALYQTPFELRRDCRDWGYESHKGVIRFWAPKPLRAMRDIKARIERGENPDDMNDGVY